MIGLGHQVVSQRDPVLRHLYPKVFGSGTSGCFSFEITELCLVPIIIELAVVHDAPHCCAPLSGASEWSPLGENWGGKWPPQTYAHICHHSIRTKTKQYSVIPATAGTQAFNQYTCGKSGSPKFTNEVQHQVKVLPWPKGANRCSFGSRAIDSLSGAEAQKPHFVENQGVNTLWRFSSRVLSRI